MEDKSSIVTSISLPTPMWNCIQKVIKDDEMSFSRFMQSSARLKLKALKIQNVREVLDILDDDELDILKKEIQKKGL